MIDCGYLAQRVYSARDQIPSFLREALMKAIEELADLQVKAKAGANELQPILADLVTRIGKLEAVQAKYAEVVDELVHAHIMAGAKNPPEPTDELKAAMRRLATGETEF